MLNDLIAHIARATGLEEADARMALGILLNSADRQGAPLAEAVFRNLPGSRALSARVGSLIGAPTGEIARLIERTPGGRRCVVEQMFRALLDAGIDHTSTSRILPCIGAWMEAHYAVQGLGQIGALIAQEPASAASLSAFAA